MANQVDARLVVAPVPSRTRAVRTLRRFRRAPIIPLIILIMFVVVGVGASWIAPYDPNQTSLRDRHLPPAWLEGGDTDHIFGTDHLGRDVYSRVIHGARISLIVASMVILAGNTIGVLIGLVSGWYGGWVDEFFMRLVDIKLAIPTILLALVLVLALGQTFILIVGVLAITIWPRIARNVRGEVLQLKNMDYVALARVAGASTPRILAVHIFPGVVNTLTVLTTLEVGIVILLESTLSFLGAGVPADIPAWGTMVSDGRAQIAVAWWTSTMPGLAILVVVMAANLFGDWLRDTLDPKLRQLA
ncbi:MAG: ABC transporter permease [Dehalococcoidia bacterium]